MAGAWITNLTQRIAEMLPMLDCERNSKFPGKSGSDAFDLGQMTLDSAASYLDGSRSLILNALHDRLE